METETMIQFKANEFEGPLSLLLKMIEKEELDITQISLAKIADQYVDYIRNLQSVNADHTADFLVIAAKLLLIKSRALLPYLYPEEEEEIEELEKQLKMYKEFLEASQKIEKMLGKKKFMFVREFNRKVTMANMQAFSPPKKLTAEEIKNVFIDFTSRVKLPEKMKEKTLERKINIEDKILSIQQMLLKRIKFSFNKLLSSAANKTEIIVSFLAMLELEKQRTIRIEQVSLFEEILIKKYE